MDYDIHSYPRGAIPIHLLDQKSLVVMSDDVMCVYRNLHKIHMFSKGW